MGANDSHGSWRITPGSIKPGESVYSESGRQLGRVSGLTENGFEVETSDLADSAGQPREELPGPEFGEGYLMWRCGDCGEMGELDDSFPELCPSCGAPREAIYGVEED